MADPSYTREPSFYLSISGFADCIGLSTVALAGGASGVITNNYFTGTPALPGGNTPGAHDISVAVTDALGNAQSWQKTLIYNPASTDTTGTHTNSLGLPVLRSGASVTADDANSIVRVLSFKGIRVNDNLSPREGNPVPLQEPFFSPPGAGVAHAWWRK